MSIPNDLIGCIIGKGGAKINEIRQLSGATIKISNSEEGSKDRAVAISGTPESINLAQYLINTSIQNAQLPLLWKSIPTSPLK
jgi:polyribonucleotide nucleotidyltransferase